MVADPPGANATTDTDSHPIANFGKIRAALQTLPLCVKSLIMYLSFSAAFTTPARPNVKIIRFDAKL